MPRRQRVFVEGAIYHVYNRCARGAEPFTDDGEAERFIDLLVQARDRDGVTFLAWCLMSNHYHLALRAGAIPLARTMAHIQSRFGSQHNRRQRISGPLWQSRYKAKLIDGERYLLQLITYVHLNPVAAGLASDPADFRHSGHRELMGLAPPRLVDVDGVLGLFGQSARSARRGYLALLKKGKGEAWFGELPGRLPWWQREPDRPLVSPPAASRQDPLGRSPGLERVRLSAPELLQAACEVLGIEAQRLAGTAQDLEVSRARYLLGGLAIERWRVRSGELARVLGRRPEIVSRWAARAGELRGRDETFRRAYEELDAALAVAASTQR